MPREEAAKMSGRGGQAGLLGQRGDQYVRGSVAHHPRPDASLRQGPADDHSGAPGPASIVHACFPGDLCQPAGPVRPQADLGRLVRRRAEKHGAGVHVEDLPHLQGRGRDRRRAALGEFFRAGDQQPPGPAGVGGPGDPAVAGPGAPGTMSSQRSSVSSRSTAVAARAGSAEIKSIRRWSRLCTTISGVSRSQFTVTRYGNPARSHSSGAWPPSRPASTSVTSAFGVPAAG